MFSCLETAINIGYSCKLLTEDMKIFTIDSEEKEVVQEQLQNAKDEIDRINELIERGEHAKNNDPMSEPSGPPFGIVMTGLSLVRNYLTTPTIFY